MKNNHKNIGTFYSVGVGPGEGDYISLGALRAVERADIIAVPVRQAGDKSTALEIVKQEFDIGEKNIMYLVFPMTRDKAVLSAARERNTKEIAAALKKSKTVAMLTLGDVSIYSTASYICEALRAEGFDTKTIPGIPSFCAAAAKANMSLVRDYDSLAVVPAGDSAKLERALLYFDTVVIMKAGSKIEDIYELLEKHNLVNCAVACSNIGMDGEVIAPLKGGGEYGYFATVIVKKNGR